MAPDPVAVGASCTLALEAGSGEIIAHKMPGQDIGDGSRVGPLLDQIDRPIGFHELRQARTRREHHRAIQVHHRTAPAGSVLPR